MAHILSNVLKILPSFQENFYNFPFYETDIKFPERVGIDYIKNVNKNRFDCVILFKLLFSCIWHIPLLPSQHSQNSKKSLVICPEVDTEFSETNKGINGMCHLLSSISSFDHNLNARLTTYNTPIDCPSLPNFIDLKFQFSTFKIEKILFQRATDFSRKQQQ